MNPRSLINIAAVVASFSSKLKKDERRVKLFIAATAAKAQQFALDGSLSIDATAFGLEAADLTWRWISLPTKLSFASLFSDPYAKLRDDVRAFAKKWQLDPAFIEEMG